MAGNIAKSFANMKLLYWAPIKKGSEYMYEAPVEFKGKYIGDARMSATHYANDIIFSAGGLRSNLVLFYMLKPVVQGYVSWEHTLSELQESGLLGVNPSKITGTHKIDLVMTLPMLDAKVSVLKNTAYIAQAM